MHIPTLSLLMTLLLALSIGACGDTDEASAPVGTGSSNATSNSTSDGTGDTSGATTADAGNDDTGETTSSDGGDPMDSGTTGGTTGGMDTGEPVDADNPMDTAADTEERVFDPGGECNPYTQDCPDGDDGDPQQCVPIQGEPRCIAQNPQQLAAEEPCVGVECAPGLTCINWGGDRGQVCTQMCDRNTREGCADNFSCSAWVQSNDNIGLCQPRPVTCDIYAQDCPDDGQACTFGRDPDTDAPIYVCASAGDRADGQTCSGGAGRCMEGLICIRTEGDEATCSRVCQEDDDCLGEQRCIGRSTTWEATFCR